MTSVFSFFHNIFIISYWFDNQTEISVKTQCENVKKVNMNRINITCLWTGIFAEFAKIMSVKEEKRSISASNSFE